MTIRRPIRSSFAEPMTKQLAWDINSKPVTVDGNILPDYHSLVRNDNGHVLSIAKKTYQPATNDKFVEVVTRIQPMKGKQKQT